MLANHPIDPMIMATDLGVARDFYGGGVGLQVLLVEVEQYDDPGLRTVDGVADVGFAFAAWFVDPDGNTIGLLQFKDAEAT